MTAERLPMTIKSGTVPKTAKRPQPKGGSRKGVPNKVTGDLKAMILQALDGAGGVEYLLACAHDDKTKGAFLSLIGKVLPMTIAGPGADGEHMITIIERRIVKAND